MVETLKIKLENNQLKLKLKNTLIENAQLKRDYEILVREYQELVNFLQGNRVA